MTVSLYEQRVVPSKENPLLELRQGIQLDALVSAFKPDAVIVMSADGEEVRLAEKFASIKSERVAVIVGGFSKGDYKSDVSKLKGTKVSLGKRMLKVGTVTSKVLAGIEQASRMPEVTPPKPSKPRRAPKKKAE